MLDLRLRKGGGGLLDPLVFADNGDRKAVHCIPLLVGCKRRIV